jgi:hypothetical protein
MKTETEYRIQDLVRQDACLVTRVEATPAAPPRTCPASPDQTDLSDVSYLSDSPNCDEALINSTAPAPIDPTIHEFASRFHLTRSRSIQPYLGLSRLKKNSPRSRLNPAITPLVQNFPSVASVRAVGRGCSQSEPSPVLFVRRRPLIHSRVPRPPRSPSAFVAKCSSRYVTKYPDTSRRQRESSRDISRFVKVCREINQKVSAVAINREINSPKRGKRSQGVLPNYRSAVVPAADTLYGQKVRGFLPDSRQPVAFVSFGQRARHETLINSLVQGPPRSALLPLNKIEGCQSLFKVGKGSKMHAGLKVKPRFNLKCLDILRMNATTSTPVAAEVMRQTTPSKRWKPSLEYVTNTGSTPGRICHSPRSGSTIRNHRLLRLPRSRVPFVVGTLKVSARKPCLQAIVLQMSTAIGKGRTIGGRPMNRHPRKTVQPPTNP